MFNVGFKHLKESCLQVEPIVNDVRKRGDAAVKEYTAKFDKAQLEAVCTPVADLPKPDLPKEVTDAFDVAYDNIRAFHVAQQGQELSCETLPGVVCRQVSYALQISSRSCPFQNSLRAVGAFLHEHASHTQLIERDAIELPGCWCCQDTQECSMCQSCELEG
jgi:hypothetical protein